MASTQPPGHPATTSAKEGAAETSMAYLQNADAPPRDLAAAGLVPDIAPAKEPASRIKRSKVKTRRGTVLSPNWLGLKNFDLADIVKSPRETITSGAALLLKNEMVLSLAVIGTMLFVLVALFFLMPVNTPNVKEGFCVTDDCLSHATLLTETRDTKFDPCHDFTAHVCFNWSPHKQSKEIRDFDSSAMEDMVYSWLLDLGTALQEGSKAFPVANKALAMLESCMSNSSTYGTNLKDFRQFLNNRSLPWPNPPQPDVDALGVLVNLAYNWQAAFLFEVRASLVRKGGHKGRRCIILTPAPTITRYHQQHRAVIRDGKDAYFKYWMDFYTALFGDTKTASKERALQTADMEGDIFDTIKEALQASPKDSAVFPIGEFEVFTVNISSSRWFQLLKNVTAMNPELTEQDVVVTTNVYFLQTVGNLFKKYTNAQILDFLGWQFVQHYAPVSDSGLLVARYGDRRTARSLRPTFCGFHIEVPYRVLLLTLRFASRLTESDKELVDAGFDRLVSTAVHLVKDSTWMDSESKALAIDKLRAARLRLWPPPEFLNETNLEELFRAFPEKQKSFGEYFIKSRQSIRNISRTPEFDTVLGMPENYGLPYFEYDYADNAIGVAIAAVARPLFYGKGTPAMFYGGFGFSVALELVKALDQEGLQWHPDGRLVHSFFSEASHAVFEAKNTCLNSSEFDSGKSVFPEIPALQIAYSAFLDSASEPGSQTHISAELTEEKVFFMTICYMTCVRKDVKNPFAADCNKIVRSSAAFAKAFRCPEGSRMNPGNKCSFF
ncbi:endothelin-converting enzyme 2-like [Amblyomma americanum]